MFRKGLASLLIAAAATAALWTGAAGAQVRTVSLQGGPSPAATDENRIALVIGNAQYRHSRPLPNPANDAQAISQLLTSAGFEVTTAADLPGDRMREAIAGFASRIGEKGPNTVALVYYAGHGLQVDGENYLIPVDAKFRGEADVAGQGIRFADLMEALEAVPSKMRIVILDACRNNPFGDANGKGLAIVDAPSGSIVAYSTAPGTEAYDGHSRHSPYAAAFMRTVKEPNLPIEQVFKKIRLLVHEATGSHQTPWESSSLTSDFVFFRDPASAAPVDAAPKLALADLAARPVRQAYEAVIAEDRIEYYREFVRLYPAHPLCNHIRLLLLRRQQMLAWQRARHRHQHHGPFGHGGAHPGPVAGVPQNPNVIPFPNGNTGINGTGRPGRVIPFPNGNTGINGTGMPGKPQDRPIQIGQNGNTGINPNAGRPLVLKRPFLNRLPQTGNTGINPKAGRPVIQRPFVQRPMMQRPLAMPPRPMLRPAMQQMQPMPAASRFAGRHPRDRFAGRDLDFRR